MTDTAGDPRLHRNVALYPWFKFFQNLIFWQAIWFLFFQTELSAAEAILLYAIYDVATTVLEVPSGYLSDRLGRRLTLMAAAVAGALGTGLLMLGGSFEVFVAGQVLLGVSAALASGTDHALLYETLVVSGRGDEIERHEVRAWRFSFVALAVSAVVGGVMATYDARLPFLAGAIAFVGALGVTIWMSEPLREGAGTGTRTAMAVMQSLRAAMTEPVLIWLFILSMLMYVFSHIPFVFGQPFILEALNGTGFEADAPLVSGAVSSLMMVLSVVVSIFAPGLRRRLGLGALLLFAFGLQIALSGVLALTNSWIAIAILFLRMVPDALSRPFIVSRIQPLLQDDSRATYLSVQSLCGRMIFAATLFLASLSTSDVGQMVYAEIRLVLGVYVGVGLVCLLGLAGAARRVRL